MNLRDLQRSVSQSATAQDAAVASFQLELRRVLSRLTRALRLELEDWATDDAGRLTRSVRNIVRVFALRKQSRELLDDSGFDALAVQAMSDPLEKLARIAIKGQPEAMGPSIRQTMDAWRRIRLGELLDVGDNIGRALQRIALDGVLGLRPVDRLILDVRDHLDVTERQARTWYDTAVSVFSREIEQATSDGDPDELFVYIGPDDEKTRPFCDKWLGKVRTREFWEKQDNGQSGAGNVMVMAGGWNCRHVLKRVSKLDDELIAIAGTNQRAHELEAVS